jgi:hypothetical protein
VPLTNFSVNWPHALDSCVVPAADRRRAAAAAADCVRGGGGGAGGAGGGGDGGSTDDNDDDDIIDGDMDEPLLDLTPEFEAHVRDAANWSIGPEFAEVFPQWRDFVNIKD